MFKKAERKAVKLKLAMTGPSGSGKTFSALRLAKGFGGKVAVIDTENESSSLYSDRFDFDVLNLEPPFTCDKYIKAINGAVEAGYSTVIIDSITHAWAGEGGILDRKGQKDAKGGNSYTNWAHFTKEQNVLMGAILHSNINVIATMRAKQAHEIQKDDRGKNRVVKLGLKPEQRDGVEYEFTVVFDIAIDHETEVSKDRTGLFIDKTFQITEDTGASLKEWVTTGKDESKALLETISEKLKAFDNDYQEEVGSFLDKGNNDSDLNILNLVNAKLDTKLNETQEAQ